MQEIEIQKRLKKRIEEIYYGEFDLAVKETDELRKTYEERKKMLAKLDNKEITIARFLRSKFGEKISIDVINHIPELTSDTKSKLINYAKLPYNPIIKIGFSRNDFKPYTVFVWQNVTYLVVQNRTTHLEYITVQYYSGVLSCFVTSNMRIPATFSLAEKETIFNIIFHRFYCKIMESNAQYVQGVKEKFKNNLNGFFAFVKTLNLAEKGN